ncbi:MAG: glycoside hydrolase family 3 [Deltaproteobacteria bacterium]|nr:glycoside hydrolase family 3 [Deltaproteobacteria bacterium]MBW2672991.1 glycoside hydrolase family 3 [Deltaproteobacteria bacterium]
MRTNTFRHKCEELIRLAALCAVIVVFGMMIPSSSAADGPETEIRAKIGQMLMVGFRGLVVDAGSPVIRDIRAGRVGGVILFDYDVPSASPVRNIESPRQAKSLVAALQGAAPIPLFIAIDQEGGRVCRLKEAFGFPPSVSAQHLGSLDRIETTKKYADTTAETLSALGINLNFAPVVDLNTNPDNPVIGKLERSFSADPAVVTRQALVVIDSLHERGILSAIKHFPGHGSSAADSHEGFVDITQTWSPEELIPFDKIVKAGKCDMIMTAHVFNEKLDPQEPATLSPKVMHILRDYMGYGGVIVSDDMQMKAISQSYGLETAIERAVLAGVDILVFANNSVFEEDIASKAGAILERLVRQGKIPAARIDASYRRIMELKERLRR